MPKFYPSLPPHLPPFALSQPLFFTATAPTHGSHINLSPKGLPSSTFSILSPTLCAYIDIMGSGAETIAHIYENGRVTVMFCSFGPNPKILRLFCRGRVVERMGKGKGKGEGEGEGEGMGGKGSEEYEGWVQRMGKVGKEGVEGGRAVVVLEVWKVQTSCGFGVPRLPTSPSPSTDIAEYDDFEPQTLPGDRKALGQFASYLIGKDKLRSYQAEWNARSLDGLPGMRVARRDNGEVLLWGDLVAWGRRVGRQREGLGVGVLVGLVLVWLGRVLGRWGGL